MDQDYRNNIAGSPYLEEGIGQQLKARAANAISAGQAPMGQQLDNPQQVKLKSLWEGFIANLKNLLADVEETVNPLIQNRQANKVDAETGKVSSPVTEEQKEMLDTLNDLYRMIEPVRPMAQAPRKQNDPTMLNKKTDVFGGKLNTSKLKELMSESAWDAIKRGFSKGGVGLTKALISRDPNKILNAYKKAILDLYNQYIADAFKVGIPKDMVSTMTKRIYPPQKYRDVLNKVESVMNMPDVGAPKTNQPAQPSTAPETPPQTATPEQPAATTQTPPQTATNGGAGAGGAGETGSLGKGYEGAETDLAGVLLKTIQIIIDAVESDEKHAEPFIGAKQQAKMPTQWGEPAPTKATTVTEADDASTTNSPDDPSAKTPSPAKKDSEDFEDEIENQFLYNFASKWNKWHNFNIEVKPVLENNTIELPISKEKKQINVIWNNKSHTNDIYVTLMGEGKPADRTKLLQFFDDQVNPKSETGKDFNVFNFVTQANSEYGELFKKADQKIIAQINELSNGSNSKLGRALYATVYRKAMEHSPIRKKKLGQLTVNDDASVTEMTKEGPKIHPKAELAGWLNADPETSKKWEDALKAVGYFQANPDMVPKPMEKYPAFQDGALALKTLSMGKGKPISDAQARELAKEIWYKLRTEFKKSAAEIKSDHIVSVYLKGHPGDESGEDDSKQAKTAEQPQTQTNPDPEKQADPEPQAQTQTTEPQTNAEQPAVTPPQGKSPEQQLAQVNTDLEAIGAGTLDDVKQLSRFFSIKGAWNTKVKNKAQVSGKEAYLKLVLGKKPDASQKKLWTRLVAKAKEAPQPKKTKQPKQQDQTPEKKKDEPRGFKHSGPAEGFINPFQRSNFLLD